MTADDPRPAGEACCKPGDLTCRNWRQCARFQFRPAASGGATDGERAWGVEPDPVIEAQFRRDIAEINAAEGRAPVASQADGELRCYCDRDRAGHEWSLDEGCTRSPVLTPGDPLREAIVYEVGEWEVFLAADGERAIRRRESRTADQIADAVLALPAVRRLLADAAAVKRVREALHVHRHSAGRDGDDHAFVRAVRRALDGDP